MAHGFNDILKQINLNQILGFIEKEIIYTQPQLSNINIIIIWSQCIKANIYKKAINIYGKTRYSIYLVYYEDAIINHIIYQLADSCAFVPIFGILYLIKKGSVTHTITEINRNFGIMKYIEAMLDFSRNTNELKDNISRRIIYYFNNNNFINYLNNSKFKNTFNSLLKKIFSSKYLTFKNKIDIQQNISNNLLVSYNKINNKIKYNI